MNVIDKITRFTETRKLIPPGSSIVVGLSGGPDSVFLLHYLVQLKNNGRVGNLIAAHLNHGWRAESDDEQSWCKALCESLGIPFVSAHLLEYEHTIKYDGSKEAFARAARKIFFEHVRTHYHADLIALGHHAQDQEETFFIRLVRGTSLSGLTGMWPKNGYIIRPLLQTNKHDIIAYLDDLALEYLSDPSNVSPDFLRNRIRAHVLPALHQADKRFDQNFLTTLNRLQETELYLQAHTQHLFTSMKHDNGIVIKQFLSQPLIMQYRLLMYWLSHYTLPFAPTQSLLDEIIRFMNQPGSKTHTIHPQLHIIKHKSYAFIDTKAIVS